MNNQLVNIKKLMFIDVFSSLILLLQSVGVYGQEEPQIFNKTALKKKILYNSR